MKRDWLVAQIGAREHYAVARAFEQRGALERLYTEFWSGDSPLINRARHSPRTGPLNALLNRHHSHISSDKVTAFNAPTLGTSALDLVAARLGRERSIEADYTEYLRVGKKFARRTISDLSRRRIDPQRHAFFGYSTGCLETMRWLNQRGVPTVVGQIDAGRVDEDLVRAENEKWPGWATLPGRIPAAFHERIAQEWETASLILVNSQWTRDALTQQGVPAEKMVVVPLAYEAQAQPRAPRAADAPLRVLWLGNVTLRRGIPYLLEAARLLEATDIRFTIAGTLYIRAEKTASAPANVEFLGRVPRAETAALYAQCDLFVLPTISDGFALTQLEAMAHGLPVIATTHCGQVVTPGVDGEIVPICDAVAVAEAILKFDKDRERLQAMSRAALEKSRQFSLENLAENLEQSLSAL